MKQFSWVLIHLICLTPASIDGKSANYIFIFLGILIPLFRGAVSMPSIEVIAAICCFTCLYLVSIFSGVNSYHLERSWISFLLFMSIFTFVFTHWEFRHWQWFKQGVVLTALLHSIYSIFSFYIVGGSQLHFEAKDLIGGQRFGFVYILAFWMVLYDNVLPFKSAWFKNFSVIIILSGIMLTFSRSSVVSLCASGLFLMIYSVVFKARIRKIVKTSLIKIIIGALCCWTVLILLFPITIEFFFIRLIELFFDNERLTEQLSNSNSSEGTRLLLWQNAIYFVLDHPITGSGYLGIWILGAGGSAHNQYIDVLFRSGLIGISIYIYIIFAICKALHRLCDLGVLIGFIGVLVYGLFHETFKESQGGYILSVLFAISLKSTKFSVLRKINMVHCEPPQVCRIQERTQKVDEV